MLALMAILCLGAAEGSPDADPEEREAARAKIEELREQRREMLARHRKELAALEAEIRAYGGRTGSRGKRRSIVQARSQRCPEPAMPADDTTAEMTVTGTTSAMMRFNSMSP